MLLDEDISDLRELLDDQSPDDTLLLAEIHIGEDAAEFVASDLGRYILGRANGEIAEYNDKLKHTASWRRRRIQDLQNEIAMRETFKKYLLQAINSGRSAFTELSQRQSEARE